MTKTRFSILILAVLTALILAGCGASDDSQLESSVEEGIQTFGVQVNPSAQPSVGQVMPELPIVNPDESGTVSGDNSGITTNDQVVTTTQTPQEETTSAPTPTKTPSSGSTDVPATAEPSPTVSPSPSTSPNIIPPAPVSSATADDVMQYVGKSFSQLIEDKGYPVSSSYEYVDENDPTQGEIGTVRFNGFTVTTLRNDEGETITAVMPDPVATQEVTEESPAEESPTTAE